MTATPSSVKSLPSKLISEQKRTGRLVRWSTVSTAGISCRPGHGGRHGRDAASSCSRSAQAQAAALNVFSPLPPDPAPPGAAKFSEEAFANWQAANGANVTYEMLAWPQLHDHMATAFASGAAPWDIIYIPAGCRSSQSFLTPFADNLPKALVDDLPPSSFATVTWDGKRYGAVFTLSLLTLFYNKEHLEQAGFKDAAQDLGRAEGAAPRN